MIDIALIHPDIPQNTGNIGRLALGIGAYLHLVRPLGFTLDDRSLQRAGLDYWKNVDLRLHDNVEAFLAAVAGRDMHFFTTKAQKSYTDAVYAENAVLVFGSESRGLPPELLRRFPDRLLRIPMSAAVRSLNVAVCAGIAAYEALRHTTTFTLQLGHEMVIM